MRIVISLTVFVLLLLAAGPAAFAEAVVEQSAASVGRYERLELTIIGWHPQSFTDVGGEHWALAQIEACVGAGIASGFNDGLYRPAWVVDRAQMAVYIARALSGGDIPTGPATASFPDVPADYWAYDAVEHLRASAVAEGYPSGEYRPHEPVTRGQMAVFVARARGWVALGENMATAPPLFPDVLSGHWAGTAIEACVEHGVVQGFPDGTYRPGDPVTRAQMAVFIQRAFALPLRYDNLFDPEQLDIVAEFTAPSAAVVTVPAFYFVPYARSRDGAGVEVLTPAGTPSFKVRFAAREEVGTYAYRVVLTDRDGTRELGSGSFEVTASDGRGYVRRSATAPRYFEFDSGESYFAIGENMCWPGEGGTYDYDLWLNALAAHGGNYLRLWLINEWHRLGLERLSLSPGDGNGLGRYDQQAAYRLDYILDLASAWDCEVLMCIESFNSLDALGIYGNWSRYPYNAEWGGPCAEPMDFFTDVEAKRLFRQRLRYLVARWGYSTAVLAWEFWNEVDLVTGYDSAVIAAWHGEMADYLRALDPWDHLITTSYADTDGDPAVDGLAEMDFVQSHHYGSHDIAGTVRAKTAEKIAAYDKPHYFGEFGTDWLGEGNSYDPEGIHFHHGLWSAMLSQSAGTAMLWWWDSYVHFYDLYHHFASVAAFAEEVDWVGEDYQPLAPDEVRYAPGHEPASYLPVTIDPPGESWEEGSPFNEPREYTVANDGSVTDFGVLSRVQHGLVNHPTWHNPATFHVTYPAAGTFEVTVSAVSGYGGAGLAISLDGTPVLEVDFPDTAPDDYETMHQYDGVYSIGVPMGAHTIVVENTGADWCYVSYRLTNYLTVPHLRVLALANETSALLWVQNREHTWWNAATEVAIAPVNQSEIELRGFTPGSYRVEEWDTYAGTIVGTSTYVSADGTVVVTTPPALTTDVAYKLAREDP